MHQTIKLTICILVIHWIISCTSQEIERPFFAEMIPIAYNRELDSLGLISSFEVSNRPKTIQDKHYWQVASRRSDFLSINGFARYHNGKVYLVPPGKECHANVEQVLFSFDKSDLRKEWVLLNACTGPLIDGDSIQLYNIYFDSALNDTIYQHRIDKFEYFVETRTFRNVNQVRLLNVSKRRGIISGILTNLIDSVAFSMMPKLVKLDSNYLGKKKVFHL